MWINMRRNILILLFVTSITAVTGYETQGALRRLVDDLGINEARTTFKVRPVLDAKKAVTVKVGLSIIRTKLRDDFMAIEGWLDMEWTDEFLKWNPDNYSSVSSISVDVGRIWTPDITLYNSAHQLNLGQSTVLAVVHHTGSVFFAAPMSLNVPCQFDLARFPFDSQRCDMKFGSWTYHGFQVNVTNRSENVDLTNRKYDPEFALINVTQTRREVYYTCCPQPYPDIKYSLIFKRQPGQYAFTFIGIPIMLSVLLLASFALQPGSTSRMLLSLTVFLAFVGLSAWANTVAPTKGASSPWFYGYYQLMIISSAVSAVLATWVSWLTTHSRKPVPQWVRSIVLGPLRSAMCAVGTTPQPSLEVTGQLEKDAIQDWMVVALVLDRLAFLVYLVVVIAAIVVTRALYGA